MDLSWLKGSFRDSLTRNIAAILAIVTTVGGFIYLFYGPKDDRAAVIALMMAVNGFYYNSSPGSQAKDKTIASMLVPPSTEECKQPAP